MFEQRRNIVIREQFGVPVTEKPKIVDGDIWLRGSVSFLLSKLTDPERFDYLYTWFICMDNITLLEIEIEAGWEENRDSLEMDALFAELSQLGDLDSAK
ncbi:hypothetical protein CHISP_2908 [Chitinispirillum alkaliphilum]|nr:hypothetical protein CHISP_2908 [Chitinispirillum alkaliphilum]